MISTTRGSASAGDGFAQVYPLLRATVGRRLRYSADDRWFPFGLADGLDECCAIAWRKHWPRLMRKGNPPLAAAIFAANDAVRDYGRGQRFTQAPTDSAPVVVDDDCELAIAKLPVWLQPTARLLAAGLDNRTIADRIGVSIRTVQRQRHEIGEALQ